MFVEKHQFFNQKKQRINNITGVPCKIKGGVESMIKGQLKCTI